MKRPILCRVSYASVNKELSGLKTNPKHWAYILSTAGRMVDNEELWNRVRALQGCLVRAALGRRTFHVVRVSADVAVLRAAKTYHLPRSTLEAAYALGRKSDALLPREASYARFDQLDPAVLVGVLNVDRRGSRVMTYRQWWATPLFGPPNAVGLGTRHN